MFAFKRLSITVFLVLFLSSCILPPSLTRSSVSVKSISESPRGFHDNNKGESAEENCLDEPALGISEWENLSEENGFGRSVTTGKHSRHNNTQEIMDEALDFLNQAQLLWEKGEIENALKLLDETYSLLLDVNGDQEISWQKDDIRVMTAKKIVAIYASRSNVAVGYQSEIPFVMNKDVEKAVQRFQRGERNFFISSFRRSGSYRPMILKQLKEAGLPEELSWLPLVESGFKIRALSSARALGLWQIIPSTGYMYGLKRDHWIDERMDPEKSTKAAIAYLKELHGIFGDWLTALAAYNCGEGRVLRVISRQKMNYLDNFWDLYRQLPSETSNYVPRFLATLHIIKDPEKYGMDLKQEQEKPVSFGVVKVEKSVNLKDVAKELHISNERLNFLNSELRYKTTPETYDLKIPSGMQKKFALVVGKIPKAKRPGGAKYIRYKVKKGDTLSVLAERYKSSVNSIVAANHLSGKHRIWAGKWLKIPSRNYVYFNKPRKSALKEGNVATYRVKKGDSLWLLANRFGTTVSEIKRLNGFQRNNLRIGQVIRIRSSSVGGNAVSAKICVVKRGDTLSGIALKNRIDLDKLLKLNNFNENTTIYPRQKVIVR